VPAPWHDQGRRGQADDRRARHDAVRARCWQLPRAHDDGERPARRGITARSASTAAVHSRSAR
jgi:hypothetical protein